jgi:hypothetical protein
MDHLCVTGCPTASKGEEQPMSRWQNDCDACRRELQALVDGTAGGLRDIQTKHSRASSDDRLIADEMSDFVNGQLGKVEQAERVWIRPHAWKEGPRRMAPMLKELANARQRIIEIAKGLTPSIEN